MTDGDDHPVDDANASAVELLDPLRLAASSATAAASGSTLSPRASRFATQSVRQSTTTHASGSTAATADRSAIGSSTVRHVPGRSLRCCAIREAISSSPASAVAM